eukprot:NODE_614_length_2887_cov_37.946739.p1 GENE.NODE_614_length_2887_cov_37.946739~~NODE_614_length_2887_cov_37.946739.p1  ORF type:complete len:841 (+),score=31.06 NODE_614_length_2887_cov_37.946739:97-2619(+)
MTSNMNINLIPSIFVRSGQPGDFEWEIETRHREEKALYIFNDNVRDHQTCNRGGGNAIIRPYNRYGSRVIQAAGVSTGWNSASGGFKRLTAAVRNVISSDVAEIRQLLASGSYTELVYSAHPYDDEIIGTSIFEVDYQVKRYIFAQLRQIAGVQEAQTLRRQFESLRKDFLREHKTELLRSLAQVAGNTQDIKLWRTPMTLERQECFLRRWAAVLRRGAACLVPALHGTDVRNFDSIFVRGLLVPGVNNKLTVKNGSVHGLGVYTAKLRNPHLARGFCVKDADACTSECLLICAVIKGADDHRESCYDEYVAFSDGSRSPPSPESLWDGHISFFPTSRNRLLYHSTDGEKPLTSMPPPIPTCTPVPVAIPPDTVLEENKLPAGATSDTAPPAPAPMIPAKSFLSDGLVSATGTGDRFGIPMQATVDRRPTWCDILNKTSQRAPLPLPSLRTSRAPYDVSGFCHIGENHGRVNRRDCSYCGHLGDFGGGSDYDADEHVDYEECGERSECDERSERDKHDVYESDEWGSWGDEGEWRSRCHDCADEWGEYYCGVLNSHVFDHPDWHSSDALGEWVAAWCGPSGGFDEPTLSECNPGKLFVARGWAMRRGHRKELLTKRAGCSRTAYAKSVAQAHRCRTQRCKPDRRQRRRANKQDAEACLDEFQCLQDDFHPEDVAEEWEWTQFETAGIEDYEQEYLDSVFWYRPVEHVMDAMVIFDTTYVLPLFVAQLPEGRSEEAETSPGNPLGNNASSDELADGELDACESMLTSRGWTMRHGHRRWLVALSAGQDTATSGRNAYARSVTIYDHPCRGSREQRRRRRAQRTMRRRDLQHEANAAFHYFC